ncbi:uncharacterized protein LOC135834589 isoform X1 [Planococcus citri]|uniref:uncharacterized protein LOC135834589 isoform X1 n=1 Tax=Planococcus citri TaxID=170843 RepID=UPI0031F7B457
MCTGISMFILLAIKAKFFPKLKQCFYCCSLRTGMFYICWISLLWNVYFLYNVKDPVEKDPASVPYILRFRIHILGDPQAAQYISQSEYSGLYYMMEMIAFTVGLIGIYCNSSWCLILLLESETCILLMYVFVTLYKLNISIQRGDLSIFIEHICTFLITAFKCYLYLIILSFCSEVFFSRIVPAAVPSPSTPASAPSVTEPTTPEASCIDYPYTIRPPYVFIMTQPCTSIYPPNEIPQIEIPHIEIPHIEIPHIEIPHIEIPHIEIPHIEIPHIEIPHIEIPHIEIPHIEIPHIEIPHIEIPHIVVQTDVVDPDAPPSYSTVVNEEPPPYTDLYPIDFIEIERPLS